MSREDFKKWVESSKRKTKPFADYKSMETAAKQQRTEPSVPDIKPIGSGNFGPIYDQFKDKPNEAIKFLMSQKDGEALGALHHKEIGAISIVWGNAKAGLQKIAHKHPEVLGNLQEILDGMHVVRSSDNRVKLESGTHFAVVSRDWLGKEHTPWLLTAFEKKKAVPTTIVWTLLKPWMASGMTQLLRKTLLSMAKIAKTIPSKRKVRKMGPHSR